MTTTYINLGGVGAAASGPHFGGDIDCRANTSGKITRVHVCGVPIRHSLSAGGQAKIANLDILDPIHTSTDEDVFRFEVPMDDIQPVYVRQTLEYLTKESPNFLGVFGQVPGDQVAQCLFGSAFGTVRLHGNS